MCLNAILQRLSTGWQAKEVSDGCARDLEGSELEQRQTRDGDKSHSFVQELVGEIVLRAGAEAAVAGE